MLVMSLTLRTATGQSVDSAAPWTLTGQFLNLYARSRTVVPPPQGFTLDLTRLRVKLDGQPVRSMTLDIQYDNELLVGSYLRTQQYALERTRAPTTSFDLDQHYITGDHVVARGRLYRATVAWAGPTVDVTVGRQRIPLGTGQFWSPLDLLNPIDPTRLERDYRSGVDAVLVEHRLGALARVGGVYAPPGEGSRSIAAGYLHTNVRGTDYSVLVGTVRGDKAVGVDFAGSRGGVGIRGEVTGTHPAAGRTYGRALLGADYGFPNTVNVTVELYYNGQGASDPTRYDLAALLTGRVLNVGRQYGATAVSYQVTPLVTIALYGVLNVNDGSGVLWPRVEYAVLTNVSLTAGLQRFSGGPRSEYGRASNLVHGEIRWFF